MNPKYAELTFEVIANDYSLWCEYVEVEGIETEEEFNSMTEQQKIDFLEVYYHYDMMDAKE